MSRLNRSPAINGNRSGDLRNSLVTSNINEKYHHTRLFHDELLIRKRIIPKKFFCYISFYMFSILHRIFWRLLPFTGHVTQMFDNLSQKCVRAIKLYMFAMSESFKANFRKVMIVFGLLQIRLQNMP